MTRIVGTQNRDEFSARLEQLAAERDPLYAEVADLTAAAEDLSAGVAAQHLAGELERCWQRSAARETAA